MTAMAHDVQERPPPFLAVTAFEKSYGGLKAIDRVSLEIHRGEVIALVGDNGAGKSTLIKMMCGALKPDAGTLRIDGRPVDLRKPSDATEMGIETVHQSLGLVDALTVPENVFLGREIQKRILGVLRQLDKATMRERTRSLLERFSISVPKLNEPVYRLSGGQRQTIAISRLLLGEPKMLIMDEPMAALGVEEGQRVLELIETLRREGIAVLIISHNLEHVFSIADRIVVLKNGRHVGTVRTNHATREDVVTLITLGTSGSRNPEGVSRDHVGT